MVCNCPDWAVPCKHLAAVIYQVSTEIDNNPFLVFTLHAVDLIKELEQENIHVSTENSEVALLSELQNPPKEPAKAGRKRSKEAEAGVEMLSYANLTPISDPLIQLLADAPVFYPHSGNFRDKYAVLLHKAERNGQRILKGKSALTSFLPPLPKRSIRIDRHTQIGIVSDANGEAKIWVDEQETEYALDQLFNLLSEISPGRAVTYQPSVESFSLILQFCINLIANGAVMPQIVKLENKRYAVRWLPASISKEVRKVTEQLCGVLRKSVQTDLSTHEVTQLITLFLTPLISLLSGAKSKDLFLDLFFNEESYPFRNPGEEALPGGINAWLQRYYITTQSNYRPAIVVDECNGERFRISLEIENGEGRLSRKIPLRKILTEVRYEKIRFGILQSLAHLSTFIPQLDEYINSRGEREIVLENRDFAPFLMQIIPAITLLNIDILLPQSLREILKPKVSVRIKSKSQESRGFIRLDHLLDYDWQVAIGDHLMSEREFSQLLQKSEGLIKYKANYLYVSPTDLEKLHKQFNSTKNLSPLEILRTALSNEYNGARIAIDQEVAEMIRKLTSQADVPLPKGLRADLRPYQARGFAWMYRNSQIGFGSVIADDMGLGKTLQVIATLLKYKEEGAINAREKAVVVAPTGLLTNWLAEFEKFAPSLQVLLYHGTNRELDKSAEFDILLTSYGVVRADANLLKKRKWQLVVIDEAQNIKNQDTAQSKAIKSIKANTCIAMSGTPVENRLSELWSIMDFANKGILGNLSEFSEVYGNPIQNQNDREAANKLKLVTAPFMMRRLKSDRSIISDLPDKIEIDSFGSLAKEQATLYQKTLQEAMATIEGVEGVDNKSLFVRQGLVLQMILALKQICNHPTQFLKNRVMDATLSGKMDLLFEKLDAINEANEKVLIFTQFTEMGTMLARFIGERYGEAPLFYHGGCTLKQRKEMVDRFQNNRADRIFVLSLKAAGTGLNLTAANHVIHYDLWWNPAVEAQATDRAYRIGQKNNVMVHRFITKGTFEERINEMIQSKKALADLTVATGENWIGNLNNNELRELFELK